MYFPGDYFLGWFFKQELRCYLYWESHDCDFTQRKATLRQMHSRVPTGADPDGGVFMMDVNLDKRASHQKSADI